MDGLCQFHGVVYLCSVPSEATERALVPNAAGAAMLRNPSSPLILLTNVFHLLASLCGLPLLPSLPPRVSVVSHVCTTRWLTSLQAHRSSVSEH